MWALIPIKNLNNAKQRLSGLLSPHERKELFRSMLFDVLKVVSEHKSISGVALVSNDQEAPALAQKFGALLIDESLTNTQGLNGAVEQGVSHLTDLGINDVMIIHGDLPLITATDIDRLLLVHQQSLKPSVTLVPDTQQQGSNCLLCSPASAMRFHYGANSLQKHRTEAQTLGFNFQLFPLGSVGLDIDLPTDVEDLLVALSQSKTLAPETHNYLKLSGISQRIENRHLMKAIGYQFQPELLPAAPELSLVY